MVDIQCENFRVSGIQARTGLPVWVAQLSAPPPSRWVQAFGAELNAARHLGIAVGEPIVEPGGQTITFTSSADTAAAIAGAIRDVVKQANAAVRRLEAAVTRQADVEAGRRATAAEQLRRLQERFPDGV